MQIVRIHAAAYALVALWLMAPPSLVAGDDVPVEPSGHVGTVRVHDGLISIDVRKASLGDVFSEIQEQAAIAFDAPESVASQLVSQRFSNLPIAQGIQRLLSQQNYLIVHAPSASAEQAPGLSVRVLGESNLPTGLVRPESGSVADRDDAASQRATRLSALADDADPATIVSAVEQSINDPHDLVRETALLVLAMMPPDKVPATLVANVALNDPNAGLRLIALEMLGHLSSSNREVATRTLSTAINDHNPEVQQLAQELLDGLVAEH